MKRNQTGSVLAISLVLLTAITLIAMMGLQRSALQTKIVVNIQHQEQLFRTCANDQEHRFDKINNDSKIYKFFYDIIDDVSINNQGEQEQNLFDLASLDDPSLNEPSPHNQPNTISTGLYIPPESDNKRITLATGRDASNYTNHYFQNDSTCTFQNRPSIESAQRTGFHFPALTVGSNSL
jgi:hypothetical protein